MEVHDGLTGVDALVGDDAETVLQALGLSDLLDGVSHGAHGLGRYVVGDAITHGWFLSNDNATEGGVVQ